MKRDDQNLELLLQKLRWLKLPAMAQLVAELLERAAKDNLSVLDVFHRLCDEERASRLKRAVDRRIRDARFPEVNTVDGFDFDFDGYRKKARARYLALHDLAFLDKGINFAVLAMDPTQAKLAFQVVSDRYDYRRSTCITTNRPFKDWPKVFPDALNAQVIAERLTERAEHFVFDGKGYRPTKH